MAMFVRQTAARWDTSPSESRTQCRAEPETSTFQKRLPARLDRKSLNAEKHSARTGHSGRTPLEGQFYEEELQRITVPCSTWKRSCNDVAGIQSPMDGMAEQVRQLDPQIGVDLAQRSSRQKEAGLNPSKAQALTRRSAE